MRGAPALHANLFRLAFLERLGGWWVDTDVALLAAELPSTALYFEMEEDHFTNSIIKFPSGHRLLTEAKEFARAAGDNVPWATTGPILLTALIRKHGIEAWAPPSANGCPFLYGDVPKFFDHEYTDELIELARPSFFMHLYNEMWRRFGIPTNLGPPSGSFLDLQFRQSGLDICFEGRIELRHLAVWIANAKAREDLSSYRGMVESSR